MMRIVLPDPTPFPGDHYYDARGADVGVEEMGCGRVLLRITDERGMQHVFVFPAERAARVGNVLSCAAIDAGEKGDA